MAQTQYFITETFMPGDPGQREARLRALLAEYRRLLEERAAQALEQEQPPLPKPGPEDAP